MENRELASEKSEMSELTWASEQLHGMAPTGTVKSRIRAASARLKWSFSRARDVWYADPRVSLKARELRDIESITGIAYGRTELRSVEALIARADALATNEADEGVYSAFAAAFRAFIGALDRTGTRGD